MKLLIKGLYNVGFFSKSDFFNFFIIFRVLLENNYEAIVERVSAESEAPQFSEQTFAQAFQTARTTFDSLLK